MIINKHEKAIKAYKERLHPGALVLQIVLQL